MRATTRNRSEVRSSGGERDWPLRALSVCCFNPPLSLPQGPAGFCTTETCLFFAGAEADKPPTQGRGRLNQQAASEWAPPLTTSKRTLGVDLISAERVSRLLISSPLSLPQGPAGFCTTETHLFFAGAKAVKPPTRGRGRLIQQAASAQGPLAGASSLSGCNTKKARHLKDVELWIECW